MLIGLRTIRSLLVLESSPPERLCIMHYSKGQKEKDKVVAQLHTDFASVLQVLLRAAIDFLRSPDEDDVVSIEQLLFESKISTRDFTQCC